MKNKLSYKTIKSLMNVKKYEVDVLNNRIRNLNEMYNYDEINNKEIFLEDIPICINLYKQARDDLNLLSNQLEIMSEEEKEEENEGNNEF